MLAYDIGYGFGHGFSVAAYDSFEKSCLRSKVGKSSS